MKDSEMGESKREQSLPRQNKGFTVEASPFNVVKIDLAIILFIGVVLLLINESLSDDPAVQLGVLLAYGVASVAWIVSKTRKVIRRIEVDQKLSENSSGQSETGSGN